MPLDPSARASTAWRFFVRHPTLVAGALCLLLVAVSAVAANLWWTRDPQSIRLVVRLRTPSAEHWFGTDHFGCDVYTRTLYDGRVSLAVGGAVAVISLLAGTGIGLVSGYDRRLDAVWTGAGALGAGTPRILLRYILPGLVAPLIVQGTYICASAILVEPPSLST